MTGTRTRNKKQELKQILFFLTQSLKDTRHKKQQQEQTKNVTRTKKNKNETKTQTRTQQDVMVSNFNKLSSKFQPKLNRGYLTILL